MSRSRRKTPINGHTKAKSEKQDKRIANRKFRRRVKIAIYHEEEPPQDLNEVSDIWDFDKDGKYFWSIDELEDEEEFERMMRK